MVQSHAPSPPAWIERCTATVRGWAATNGYDYELVGDELLALAPAEVRAKADGVLPVTDAARLVLLRDRLASQRWDRVAWLDADVLVFAPERLFATAGGAGGDGSGLAVCDEVWVTGGPGGGLRAVRLVNNAVLVAAATQPLDELLAAALERSATAPGRLAPRSLGPDLLTPRHRLRPYPLVPGAALCSPHVVRDLAGAGDGGAAVDLLAQHLTTPIGAVNLCASTGDDPAVFDAAVDRLLADGARLLQGRAPSLGSAHG